MNNFNKKLKLRKGLIVEDLVKKFEENSPIVKSLKDTTVFLKKLFIVGIIYFCIICFIQKYVYITLLFITIVTLSIIFYVIRKSTEILYLNSKYIGRNKAS